jgi:hypothetical protein
MPTTKPRSHRSSLLFATVTPLASILGSGLLIIVPVLERTLGALAVFGAVGVCVVAWLVGSVIRHNVATVEALEAQGELDRATRRVGTIADAVIVVAYVISVALYLRIMAQYMVQLVIPDGSELMESLIAATAVVAIVTIGIIRGFDGLDFLDRVSVVAVLALTALMVGVFIAHDGGLIGAGSLGLPPVADSDPLQIARVLGGIVITVQGFETIRYLGDEYTRGTRIRASRVAQLVAAGIYIVFVVVATPVMGLGTDAGADNSLLDITARVAPWLAIPLVLSAVLSQFSAAIADTGAADGNLRALNRWFHGPRPYLISGVAAVAIVLTLPTLVIVATASRAFAAYYALEAVIAFRSSRGVMRKIGFGAMAVLMLAVTVFAVPAN